MNVFKILMVMLFLYTQLDAVSSKNAINGTREEDKNAQALIVKNDDFINSLRELSDTLKQGVGTIVNDPDKLETAATVLNTTAEMADKIIEFDDKQSKQEKKEAKDQRLAVYKGLCKRTGKIVKALRTSVNENTITTIPAAAKILTFAVEIGTAFPDDANFKKLLKNVDARIGEFIEHGDKILGNNLHPEVFAFAGDVPVKQKSCEPSLLDLRYLFWFEQCILPLVPESIMLNYVDSDDERQRITYRRRDIIKSFESTIKSPQLRLPKKLLNQFQEEIKALKIYNKNPEGPFSYIVFNGGKVSNYVAEGLLSKLSKQERQELKAKKKSDEDAAKGPAIDATWWFSKRTWNVVFGLMKASANQINKYESGPDPRMGEYRWHGTGGVYKE